MRKKIIGLTNAVRELLREHDGAISSKDICHMIKDKGLVSITAEQEEITYCQPNFYHAVRRTLLGLVRKQEAVRVSRGMYKWHASNT